MRTIDRLAKRMLPKSVYRRCFEPYFQELLQREAETGRSGRLKALGALLFSLGAALRPGAGSRSSGGLAAWFGSLAADLRYAARLLARQPGFTLAACLVLALGMGVNLAVFNYLNAVLLQPLSMRDPQQLALLWASNPAAGIEQDGLSYPDYRDLKETTQAFESLSTFVASGITLTEPVPVQIPSLEVEMDLFETLGVKALHGRLFTSEDSPDAPLVILSHKLWRQRFGADPAVVGSSLVLEGAAYTVVGILPQSFRFPTDLVGFWMPMQLEEGEQQRNARWLQVVGRLSPGTGFEQAAEEMHSLSAHLEERFPDTNQGWTVTLKPLHQAISGHLSRPLWLLQAAALSVLLLACVNLAGLFLARMDQRAGEMALRRALGAAGVRLIRHLSCESLLISLGGMALGLVLALLGTRWILALLPIGADPNRFEEVSAHSFPRFEEVATDHWTLAAGLLLAFVTTLVFGILASWSALSSRLLPAIQSGGPTGRATSTQGMLRRVLVPAQFALALLLLTGTGLLLRSFQQVLEVDPGFRSQGVLCFEASLGSYRQSSQRAAFALDLERELSSLPGVDSVGMTTNMPFYGVEWQTTFQLLDQSARSEGETPQALRHAVNPSYFRTLGIPLLRGRLLSPSDDRTSPRVVLVNQALAERYWPDGSALGEHIHFGRPQYPFQIVGIVGNSRHVALDKPAPPEIFLAFQQSPAWFMTVAVRSPSGDPHSLIPFIRTRLKKLDARLPMDNIDLLQARVERSTAGRRFVLWLTGLFSAQALLLAAAGIYGVLSLLVGRRRHEMGIRLALGATPRSLLTEVTRRGLILASAGLAAGLPLCLALGSRLSEILYQSSPSDPWVLAVTLSILVLSALMASILPARRASKVDPSKLLRAE